MVMKCNILNIKSTKTVFTKCPSGKIAFEFPKWIKLIQIFNLVALSCT